MARTRKGGRWRLSGLITSPSPILLAGVLGFCILCALGGGGSRPDILSLLYVRVAAAWLLAVAVVFAWRRSEPSPVRPLQLMLAALAVWMIFQLIPFPPPIWQAMPGHGRYAEAIDISPEAWRSISLVPRLTWNSLAALAVPAALLAALAIQPTAGARMLLVTWLIICLASAALGIIQVIGPDSSPLYFYRVSNHGYAVGLFANRNHQAAFLAAALPVLGVWASARTQGQTPLVRVGLSALAAGLLLVGILATGSRAGLLLGILGLAAAAALVAMRLNAAGHSRKLLLAGVALPVMLGLLVTAFAVSGHRLALTRLTDAESYTHELRLVHASLITSMARAFFPFGTGFGSFDSVFRGFEPDATLQPTFFNHAHNDYLELALTGGLPGLLIGLTFVAWWGRRSWLAWQARSSVGLTGSAVILLMLAASVVDYPLRTPLAAAFVTIACWLLALSGSDVASGMSPLPATTPRLTGTRRRRAGANDRAS